MISPATASSEVAFQKKLRNSRLRPLRSTRVRPLTAMIAHEATDMTIRIASSVLPTASLWLMKWAKPGSAAICVFTVTSPMRNRGGTNAQPATAWPFSV